MEKVKSLYNMSVCFFLISAHLKRAVDGQLLTMQNIQTGCYFWFTRTLLYMSSSEISKVIFHAQSEASVFFFRSKWSFFFSLCKWFVVIKTGFCD